VRILLFNWRDITNPQSGGAEVHMHEMFKRVAKLGHRVTLVCCGYPGSRRQETLDELRIIRLGNWMTYGLLAVRFYATKARKEHFDLVVEDISKAPLFTPLYVREPLLAIWHMRHGALLFKEAFPPVAAFISSLESLMPLVYRTTPFVVVSESTKAALVSQGMDSRRIEIIYNGVGGESLEPGPRAAEPLVVYVGRVVRYKQLDHLLRAFRLVRAEIPSTRLIIGGRGNDYARLRKIMRQLRLDAAVTLAGALDEEQKREILQQAWVYAIPSMQEGWGISVIEANACGTPAIGYDVPGLRDAIRDRRTGLLVRAGSIDGLAKAIVRVLGEDALREALGREALEHAGRFGWDGAAATLRETLEKVARSKRRLLDK
jgi:glycosyltransferase involved in cell wall biosynthesis